MKHHTDAHHSAARSIVLMAAALCISILLVACGGGNANPVADSAKSSSAGNGLDANSPAADNSAARPYQVGTESSDPQLPPEPSLPADMQICSTLQASNNLVTRPDGALPPEMDPSIAGAQVAQTATWPADPSVGYSAPVLKVNPDQNRIQAALDACGAQVNSSVGSAIAAADDSATAVQAANAGVKKGTASYLVSGASAQTLRQAQFKAPQFAVRLVVNSSGAGNAFITGPLTLPSGVTLWIDKGVTLFGSRDAVAYSPSAAGPYCANVAVGPGKAGSSGNCAALITATNVVNSAVMGEGTVDGRGYAEIVTSNKLYPLLKVDLSCSNTYAAYASGTQAPDGAACDNGGTYVNSRATPRNMTWWDLAWLGNMVDNGTTGVGSQSNPRLLVVNYAKNFTLYKITLSNSANFHVVPSGVDGLTVWGTKVLTPSLAAFANPAGNGNPLYTGFTFNADNVKNTDAFDPGSASKAVYGKLTTGSGSANPSAGSVSFDGFLKNFFFAYNHVSTGDDDMVLKGSNNPSPASANWAAVDGSRGVFSNLPYGIVIAHNHFYWGHGVSIGSETNAGVRNVEVYDNSFNGSEEALRIKTDWARGGEVANIHYNNICIRNVQHSLLFTSYYSTKALPASGPLVPNIHDISLNAIAISGGAGVIMKGFAATAYNGTVYPQNPLTMTLNNVVTDNPNSTWAIGSDANITLTGLNNLPLFSDASARFNVQGVTSTTSAAASGIAQVVDCSKAYVDFPSPASPFGTTWLSRL